MKSPWSRLAQDSHLHEEEDFERAAYRLMSEQVLYGHERGSRHLYQLVEDHLDSFAAVFAPFGVQLQRNPHHRYIIARPLHGEGQPLTLDETLLLLILRHQYDTALRQGQVEDYGEVSLHLPELQEAYQTLLARPMPEIGPLRQLLRQLRRWQVLRLAEDESHDGQPFHIVIRPAICELLGEQWLQRLALHQGDEPGEDEDGEDIVPSSSEG